MDVLRIDDVAPFFCWDIRLCRIFPFQEVLTWEVYSPIEGCQEASLTLLLALHVLPNLLPLALQALIYMAIDEINRFSKQWCIGQRRGEFADIVSLP